MTLFHILGVYPGLLQYHYLLMKYYFWAILRPQAKIFGYCSQ